VESIPDGVTVSYTEEGERRSTKAAKRMKVLPEETPAHECVTNIYRQDAELESNDLRNGD